MVFLRSPLAGFSPGSYVATLLSVVHSDGLYPDERERLEQHASRLGVDWDALPEVPEDLSYLPWVTRILVYRDAHMLASADGALSSEIDEYLTELAGRMGLSIEKFECIRLWAHDYAELLERFDEILRTTE